MCVHELLQGYFMELETKHLHFTHRDKSMKISTHLACMRLSTELPEGSHKGLHSSFRQISTGDGSLHNTKSSITFTTRGNDKCSSQEISYITRRIRERLLFPQPRLFLLSTPDCFCLCLPQEASDLTASLFAMPIIKHLC